MPRPSDVGRFRRLVVVVAPERGASFLVGHRTRRPSGYSGLWRDDVFAELIRAPTAPFVVPNRRPGANILSRRISETD